MKRVCCLMLAVVMLLSFTACTEKFKMSKITTITVAGPGTTSDNSVEVNITAENGSDFTEILRICQGEIVDIDDNSINFGFAKIVFTDTSGNQTTIYPACDGSSYIRLYTLKLDEKSFIKIPDEDMKKLTEILAIYGVFLNK